MRLETEGSSLNLQDFEQADVKKISSSILDLRNIGLEDWLAYHVWNWIIILDSLGKYILYNTDLFGHYGFRRGILGMYSVVYPSIAIAILYVYAFLEQTDKAFLMIWVYKLQ